MLSALRWKVGRLYVEDREIATRSAAPRCSFVLNLARIQRSGGIGAMSSSAAPTFSRSPRRARPARGVERGDARGGPRCIRRLPLPGNAPAKPSSRPFSSAHSSRPHHDVPVHAHHHRRARVPADGARRASARLERRGRDAAARARAGHVAAPRGLRRGPRAPRARRLLPAPGACAICVRDA
jgi:hypothetical protein